MPETIEAMTTDEELVARFQRGDEVAFDDLVRRHRGMVYRVAWRLTGNHAEADDLAQEAFVRAYRSLAGFRHESLFRTWMTRIVMNLGLTWRQTRRPGVPIETARGLDGGAIPADRSVLRSEVRRAIDLLPRRQRQVVLLKVYEGLKFVEIAEVAGMSVGTAKATFFQAVHGLRGRLGLDRPPAGEGAKT